MFIFNGTLGLLNTTHKYTTTGANRESKQTWFFIYKWLATPRWPWFNFFPGPLLQYPFPFLLDSAPRTFPPPPHLPALEPALPLSRVPMKSFEEWK